MSSLNAISHLRQSDSQSGCRVWCPLSPFPHQKISYPGVERCVSAASLTHTHFPSTLKTQVGSQKIPSETIGWNNLSCELSWCGWKTISLVLLPGRGRHGSLKNTACKLLAVCIGKLLQWQNIVGTVHADGENPWKIMNSSVVSRGNITIRSIMWDVSIIVLCLKTLVTPLVGLSTLMSYPRDALTLYWATNPWCLQGLVEFHFLVLSSSIDTGGRLGSSHRMSRKLPCKQDGWRNAPWSAKWANCVKKKEAFCWPEIKEKLQNKST